MGLGAVVWYKVPSQVKGAPGLHLPALSARKIAQISLLGSVPQSLAGPVKARLKISTSSMADSVFRGVTFSLPIKAAAAVAFVIDPAKHAVRH